MKKTCRRCGTEKEINEFYKHKQTIDGYLGVCKECVKNREKERYEKNKEKKLKYQKEYKEKNREKALQSQRDCYHKNKEYYQEWNKQYYEENKNKKIEYQRQYYQEHKEQCLERHRQYVKTPKGREVERNRRHKRREYLSNFNHKRYLARKETDITSSWLKELREQTEFCLLCGTKMNSINPHPAQAQLDHIIPLCVGGRHIMKNVRFICALCNNKRPKDGSDVQNLQYIKKIQ